MKRTIILFLILVGMLSLMSCEKDKDIAYFTFDGETYSIDKALLVQFTTNYGETDEESIYQFAFASYNDGDTTTLTLALFDNNESALAGNYPSLDEVTGGDRGLIPFYFIIFSSISFQDETVYFTGEGGSVDASVSDNKYKLSFNSISVGEYDDIFDSNDDGDSEYTEEGTIGGGFSGTIEKTLYELDSKSALAEALHKFMKK